MEKLEKMSRKYEYYALAIIIIIALCLRLLKINLNLWQDEVYTVMAAKGILLTGLPYMPSKLLYVRAFPYTYLVAICIKIFGTTETAVRLVSLITGLMSIPIFYFIFKKLTNSIFYSSVVVCLLSLLPWHLTYSLFARSYILQATLFLLTVWYCYLFLLQFKIKYFLWSIVSMVINLLFTPTAVLSLFAIGYAAVYYCLYSKQTKKYITIYSFTALVLALIGLLLPGVIPAWPKAVTQNPTSVFDSGQLVHLNLYFMGKMFNFFPIGFPVFLVSLFYFFKKDKKFFILPFFLTACLLFLSIINPFDNFQPRYLSNFLFVFYLSIFYTIYVFTRRWSMLFFIIPLLVISDVFILPYYFRLDYGTHLPKTMRVSDTWTEFPEIKSQVEYVNAHYHNGDIVISLLPKGQAEVNLDVPLQYILRTSHYLSEGHDSNNQFVDDYSSIPIITSDAELMKVLAQRKRIYLISSKSEDPSIGHITESTERIIKKYGIIVYKGRDVYSKVYLFNAYKGYALSTDQKEFN